VMARMSVRLPAWARLARDLDLGRLEALTREIGLHDAVQAGTDILAGRVRGRLVVDVNR
jgi:acrylyl-CoA reductase (NADPH)